MLQPLLAAINRLDRHTSGLVFFALNRAYASNFQQRMEHISTQKKYLCRVLGEFPTG